MNTAVFNNSLRFADRAKYDKMYLLLKNFLICIAQYSLGGNHNFAEI